MVTKSRIGKLYNMYFRKLVDTNNYSAAFTRLKKHAHHRIFKTPIALIVEITNLCNYACETCPTKRDLITRPKVLMSFENFKKIIDNSKDIVDRVALYWTNEPLTHKDIGKFIKYAKDNNLITNISTNTSLLNEKISRDMLEAGLDVITVCMDGMSRESYENFRGADDFEVVKENIIKLTEIKNELNSKTVVRLQFILNSYNQDEVDGIEAFAEEHGIDELALKTFGLPGYFYGESERNRLVRKFLPTKKGVDKRFDDENLTLIKKNMTKCDGPISGISVTVEGDIALCCYDFTGKHIYGNLVNENLKDILKSENAKKIIEGGENMQYEICQNCQYVGQ
jgi:radical SAM protein with 4Fe4S-binding SPASM domain